MFVLSALVALVGCRLEEVEVDAVEFIADDFGALSDSVNSLGALEGDNH